MSTVLGQPVTLGGEGAVKYNTSQTLTVAQKEQARENIDAVAKDTSSSVAFSVGYDAGGLYVIA